MNYEDMSDFEINKLVAKKVFNSHEWVCVNSWSDGEFIASLVNYTQEKFDPCNNPSDAWPIIVENEISIIFTEDYCHAGRPNLIDGCWDFEIDNNGDVVKFETYEKNPLRAAIICFLKMKDAEQ